MSTRDANEEVGALLARCEDELLSPADAALLTSRFASVLSEDLVRSAAIDLAIDCRSFAEGAVLAARREHWQWTADSLSLVAELAAHHGLSTFAEVAEQVHLRDSRSTRAISLWAESADRAEDVVRRYQRARGDAECPAEIDALVLRYVEHSPDRGALETLLQREAPG